MKKLVPVLMCAVLMFSMAGCKENKSLPSDIRDIDGVVKKEENETLQTEPPAYITVPRNSKEPVIPQQHEMVEADNVQNWFASAVSGAFEDYSDGTENVENYQMKKAALNSGGDVIVASYGEIYYHTTFRYLRSEGQESLEALANDGIAIYLDRALTNEEKVNVSDAIRTVLMGGEMVYLDAFGGYITGACMADDTYVYIQVA